MNSPWLGRGAVLGILVLASTVVAAPLDVTGSYSGTFTPRKGDPSAASAAITQSGKGVTGSIVIQASLPDVAGVFSVSGTAAGSRVRLRGTSGAGARLTLRGRVSTGGMTGTIRLRGPQSRAVGKLALTRNDAASGSGASCDAVFTQNQTFFETQVLDQVLTRCAACHVPGGAAQAARFRVTVSDPLATARSVALLVNPTDPAASRILQKPLGLIPHGGGQQIVPGSSEEQILRSWVDLIAQAQCITSSPVAGGVGALFAQSCAGCHGSDGSGGARAPDIRCTIRPRIVDAVRRGRGTIMPAFGTAELGAADLRQVEEYLASHCTGKPADVFASNCATCHGATGGGGRNADGIFGPNIQCSEAGDLSEAVWSGGEGMPAFGALGQTAIAKLVRYTAGLCASGGGGGD